MAKAGLSFSSPLYGGTDTDVSRFATAEYMGNPAASSGLNGIGGTSLASMAALTEQIVKSSQFEMPTLKNPPAIAFSPSQKKLFVQGQEFAADDATRALQSESLLRGPSTAMPQGGDWVPLDEAAYSQYLDSIKNPSMGRLAKKNFGIGIDNTQLLAGRALQLAGAEKLGGSIVEQQQEDLGKTLPFQREFTDIGSKPYGQSRGVLDWFVANLAQQGPNLVESVVTAAAGFAAGTATAGPLASVPGALAALAGKAEAKQAILAAAKKYAAGQATKEELKILSNAAGVLGAATTSLAQNYATGAADIYGEQRDQGVGAEDMRARVNALMGAFPYAALESLPEFMLASRVLGGGKGIGSSWGMAPGATRLQRGAGYAGRAAVGGVAGGTLEGLTETGQEGLLLGISEQDFSNPENINRLINSFAAGFGVGGPIGAIANLKGTAPANILTGESTDPTGKATGTGLAPYNPPPAPPGRPFTDVQFMGAIPPEPPALGGPSPTTPQLPGPTPPVSPMGGPVIMAGMGPNAADVTRQDVLLRQQGNVPPGATPGSQGVLDIFGGTIPAQELAARMQPQQPLPGLPAPSAAPVVDPRQGALQFSGPAPQAPANPILAQRMQAALASQQRAQEFQAAQAQRAAQEEAIKQQQLDRLQNEARIQQQLDLMTQSQQPAPQSMPMRPIPVSQPQQLPLFKRGELPRPSRAEGLRRGVGTQTPAAQALTIPPTAGEFQRAGQGILFNQQGQPSMQALRSAGKKQPLPKPTVAKGVTQAKPTGKPVTAVTVAKAASNLKKGAPDATQKGKQQQGSVSQRKQDNAGVQGGGQAGNQPTTQVQGGGTQAGGGGKSLQRGAQQTTQEVKTGTARSRQEARNAAGAFNFLGTPKGETLKKGSEPKKVVAAKPAAATKVEKLSPAEAWEDMKPEGGVAYNTLSDEQKKRWATENYYDRANMQLADEINAQVTPLPEEEELADLSYMELLDEDIATAESTTDTSAFRDAIENIMFHAYFDTDSNNEKAGVIDKAQMFLLETGFTEDQRGIMDTALLDVVNDRLEVGAAYTRGNLKGTLKPWFTYAQMRNLLPSIGSKLIGLSDTQVAELLQARQISEQNVPVSVYKKYKTSLPASESVVNTKKVTSLNRIVDQSGAKLANFIRDLVTRVREIPTLTKEVVFGSERFANIKALTKQLYSELDGAGRNYMLPDGSKVKDYFNDKGEAKLIKSDGRYILSQVELTEEQQRAREEERRAELRALGEAAAAESKAEQDIINARKRGARGSETVQDWDKPEGNFYRDDGTPMGSAIPLGRVKLLVKGFLAKLKVKPTVHVYANVADLQARNPELYQRAAAARKQGDFDTTNAVGYSFGPEVIIFSDFVRTEQQLKFVLAHETIGHFGFKGVMGQSELNKVLNRIYQTDPDVQAAVDAMVETQGMDRLEAIEEYLADNAADLDVSIIARLWNALKNALNKLGFSFKDDEARQLVNLARRYVREGSTGNFFSASSFVGHMEDMEQTVADGKYARNFAGNIGSRGMAMNALNRRFGPGAGMFGSMDAFQKGLFGKTGDVGVNVGKILEKVQTLDNMARKSYGLNQIFRIFEQRSQKARALLSKYSRYMAFTHTPRVFGFGDGVSEEEKQQAGELAAYAALFKSRQLTDELMESYGSMITKDAMGNVTVDPRVRQLLEKAGTVTAEEFRKGFDVELGTGERIKYQFNVDENSPVWRVYTEMRETVNDAAVDLLLSNYEASQAEQQRVFNELAGMKGLKAEFSAQDLAAIRKVIEMYQNIRYGGSRIANASVEVQKGADQRSEKFIYNFGRALFNDDVFDAWMKNPRISGEMLKDFEEFQKAEYDDIRAAIPAIRDKIRNKEQAFAIQKAVQDIFLFDLQTRNAEFYAKRTILGSYVPFSRRGEYQARVAAFDAQGNPVRLDENIRDAMPYFQFETESEATAAREALENEFGNGQEWILKDEYGAEIKVTLRAESSEAAVSPSLTEAVNFNEFIYVLNRLNVNITPTARERIVKTLTNQNDRARKNLQRSGNPGWDSDIVRSVSEHLEMVAHVAAKKIYRHRLDDIMLNNSSWLGDPQKLKDLQAAIDTATTDGQRVRAQRAYDEYAFMYKYMAPKAAGVTVNGEPTLGQGERYREEAKKLIRWYNDSSNINDSTEDMLSGEAGSFLKLITVLMQLGGSVASAAVNFVSLLTHSTPYLSYYNAKRGYGGGYGEAKAVTSLYRAALDAGSYKLEDAGFLNDLLVNGGYDKYGLTEDETKFLFDATEQGTLQAAQFNALVGTARGKVFNNKAQAGIKAWMAMFSYTEQANRRITALAAYRLEKERALSQGLSEEQAIAEATEAARIAVNTSQGEYAMFNRPEMARGNVAQYIFMYKQFVIITVQLLRNMPVRGQLLMLGLLLMMSGLKGIPFADDLADIVDTIAQMLGLKVASIEKATAEWVDSVAPGMSPYVMRGLIDRAVGATVSTRLGMGDLVPLTGALKAGADPAREIGDFAGPVFSGISGLVSMAGGLAKYGAEVTGLRDDTTSLNTLMRESPIAALRSVGDSFAYLSSGDITNVRGQMVAKDAQAHVILARLLGFYPAVATQQNDIVRMSKQVNEYGKAIKAEYVAAYVKARAAGDQEAADNIASAVSQWNEDSKGTGLEITKFLQSANRAYREAQRPTVLRYMKSAPRAMRPETIELLRLYGLDDEIM
jgi:hypothetical protein